jgi:hypothetical protein
LRLPTFFGEDWLEEERTMKNRILRTICQALILVIFFVTLSALPKAVWGEGEEQGHKLEFPENQAGHDGIKSPCGGKHTGGTGPAIALAGGTHTGGLESCPPNGTCTSVAGGVHSGGLESCPPSGSCTSVAGGVHSGGVETCPPGATCSSIAGGTHSPLTTDFLLESVPEYVAWAARNNDTSTDSNKTIAVSTNGSIVFRTASISLSGGGKGIGVYAYNAETGNQIWGRLYSDSFFADPKAIALNPIGSMVYVYGSSFSSAQSSIGFIVIAYRATDGAVMWTRRNTGSPGSSPDPSSINVSKDGTKVFAFGTIFNPATSADYKTIGYNASNGAVIFTRNYNGPDSGLDIAVSATNSSDGTKFIVTGFNTDSGTQNYYTTCYSTNGGILWSYSYDNSGSDRPFAIAAGPGRVYITGSSFGSGSDDIFTVSLNDTNGDILSARRYEGPNSSCSDFAFDIDIDPNSTKYCIAGASDCDGNKDGYIACYDDDENSTDDGVIWESCYDGPASGSDRWNSIKIGLDSGVYVNGTSAGVGTPGDCLSARFNIEDGASNWKRRFCTPNSLNQGLGIAVNPDKSKVYTSCENDNLMYRLFGYFTSIGIADLVVTRTDEPNPVVVGQNLTSTIMIKNNGPETSTNISMRINFPINTNPNGRVLGVDIDSVTITPSKGTCELIKFDGSIPPGVPLDDINVIRCFLGNLAPGDPPVTVTVVGPTTALGIFEARADAFSGTPDPDRSNNFAVAKITVVPPQPIIIGFSPMSGQEGTSVTITGTNLANATLVKFGNTIATIISNSDTQIVMTVPAGATTGKISVTTSGGTALSSNDFIIGAGIGSFTPSSGPAGTIVTITGAGFTGVTSVKFNGISAVFRVVSANMISATVPVTATSGKITITTSGGILTSATDFLVSPKINSVSPTSGKIGSLVLITGNAFTGAITVSFNGVNSPNFTVLSSTSIRTTVPPGASSGPVSVTTPSGTATSTLNFTVLNGISSFTPTTGPVGTEVEIIGAGLGGTTGVKFGNATTTPISVTNSSVKAVVPSNATTGLITLTGPSVTLTSSLIFKVSPTIDSFTPTSGTAGTIVTIGGTTFVGVSSVKIGNAASAFTVQSFNSLRVTVPPLASSSLISVTTAAGTATSEDIFTVLPKINTVSPAMGKIGALITITGTGFGGANEVKFNGVKAASFTFVSPTLIRTNVPPGATTGPVTVTTPSGTAASTLDFKVLAGISNVNPPSGPVGTEVEISGAGFSGATGVKFGNATTTPTLVTDSSVKAIVPPDATTGLISVTTPTGTLTSPTIFKVPPTIGAISPLVGAAGTSVTVTGRTFVGVTSVKFGAAASAFSTLSSTTIRANVPLAATSGPISVTTTGGTATSVEIFTVQPKINSVSPAMGKIGALITITGAGFSGATEVSFNGVKATSFTVVSPTLIRANVPLGATTGNVRVTTPSGTATSAGNFTVAPTQTINFQNVTVKATLKDSSGSEGNVELKGSIMAGFFIGPNNQVADVDNNGLNELPLNVISLNLSGPNILVRLRAQNKDPFQQSTGEIGESVNIDSNLLDISQSSPGTARLKVFLEIVTPNGVFHSTDPAILEAPISQLSPGQGVTFTGSAGIALFNESGQPTGMTAIPKSAGLCAVGRFEFVGGTTAQRIVTVLVLWLPLIAIVLLRRRVRINHKDTKSTKTLL